MTLLEIMVVVMIMAAIASAVAVSVMKAWRDAQNRNTLSRARTIQSAAATYVMDRGHCPSMEDLEAGHLDPTTEHTDAWGRAFAIECDDLVIHVRSAGADGQSNTEDDIGF